MSDRISSLDDFLLLLKGVKQGKDGQCTARRAWVTFWNRLISECKREVAK